MSRWFLYVIDPASRRQDKSENDSCARQVVPNPASTQILLSPYSLRVMSLLTKNRIPHHLNILPLIGPDVRMRMSKGAEYQMTSKSNMMGLCLCRVLRPSGSILNIPFHIGTTNDRGHGKHIAPGKDSAAVL
ncbi:hypothetical protein Bbelb_211350 [Branchiostoma belcheri]|nr:hypothetical protein Bbelb_211350 [Branchiostoma belcheri]